MLDARQLIRQACSASASWPRPITVACDAPAYSPSVVSASSTTSCRAPPIVQPMMLTNERNVSRRTASGRSDQRAETM